MNPAPEAKVIEQEFGEHFELPAIRTVTAGRPLAWLKLGIADLRANPVESLAYGTVVAVTGWLIWAFSRDHPQLFTSLVTGFLLLAPLLAAGLYEISRRQEQGLHTSFGESLQGWRRSGGALVYFGLALVIWAILWERISAIVIALSFEGTMLDFRSFVQQVFLSGEHLEMAIAFTGVGALFASVVFVVSAISIPMLLDRDCDIYTAMATSFLAVMRNIGPMLVWAALIVVLTAAGFATLLFGMIVIFPVLGHATWHAYRELTSWP